MYLRNFILSKIFDDLFSKQKLIISHFYLKENIMKRNIKTRQNSLVRFYRNYSFYKLLVYITVFKRLGRVVLKLYNNIMKYFTKLKLHIHSEFFTNKQNSYQKVVTN